MEPGDNTAASSSDKPKTISYRTQRAHTRGWISIILALLVSVFCLTAAGANLLLQYPSTAQALFGPCKSPALRREWRSLDDKEKHRFIAAVQCLWDTPSTFKKNGSAYDDLAYVHRWAGQWSHQAASFLPWHRYFLRIFEISLKETCGFTDQLPYWDWSLDWEDPSSSPIWDAEHGFGGDGNKTGPFILNEGRCLVDGPFMNSKPLYDNYTSNPHCISRGFKNSINTSEIGRLSGYYFRPEGMDHILGQPDFDKFHDAVEQIVHDSLHNGINGDFGSLTSANDPIFYVHHVQMDRVWWQWQSIDPIHRQADYAGRSFYESSKEASLHDILSYLGFTENLTVLDVMSTRTRRLCYRY